jgi:hypothetical protein
MRFGRAWLVGLTGFLAVSALAAEPAPDDAPPAWLAAAETLDAAANLSGVLALQPYAFSWSRWLSPKVTVKPLNPVKPAKGAVSRASADIRGRAVSLGVAQSKSEARALAETAKLKLDLPDLSMDAALSAGIGKDTDKADVWHRRGLAVNMKWSGVPKTEMALTGASDFSLTYRDPSSIGVSGGKPHVLSSGKDTANFTANVAPLSGVSLEFGAAGSEEVAKDSTAESRSAEIASIVETQGQEVFANAAWKPLPWISLDAGTRERSTAIAWRAKNVKSDTVRSMEPHAAMTLDLSSETQVSASLERTPATYNTGAYVAYASTALVNEKVPVKPDYAWQFKTKIKGKIGPADVTAAYTSSYDGSVTEYDFARSGTQAPVSTPLETKDEANISLSLPLHGLGFTDTSLIGNAEWRESRVRDPLSGEYRRASGEVPAKLTLKLERKLPRQMMLMGLSGEIEDSQVSYQTKQVSEVAANGRIGAYFAYVPGPYELRLAMDGLVGTQGTTDYVYRESRISREIPSVVEHPAPGPTVKLTLRRPM